MWNSEHNQMQKFLVVCAFPLVQFARSKLLPLHFQAKPHNLFEMVHRF